MQARREDSVTGEHKQFVGGGHKNSTASNSREWTKKQSSLLRISTNSGVKTKKKKKKKKKEKGLHLKKYANIHDFWGETTKKGSLMQNLRKSSSC